MKYEWNHIKANINLKKHKIDFADAVTVFYDDQAITIEDPDHDEERFITLGIDATGRLLVIAYAHVTESLIRVISARKANKIEHRFYGG